MPKPKQPVHTLKNPGTSTQVFAPLQPLPKKDSSTKRVVAVILLVTVLFGAAVTATYIFDKKDFVAVTSLVQSIAGQKKLSQDTSRQVLESLFSITTADVDVSMVTSGKMFASPTGSVTSKIHGSFDPKGSGNGSYELTYGAKAENGSTFAPISLSILNVISSTYFQADGLPNIFLISDALNDQWIDISQNVQKANFQYPKINKEETLSNLVSSHVFTLGQDIGSEKVNDIQTNHYKIDIDKAGLANFLKAFAKSSGLTTADENIQKGVDSVSIDTFEVWIGTTDFFPYKIVVQLTTQKNADIHFEDGTLSATLIFSKLNEVKEIAAPKDAVTLPQALLPAVQGFVGGLFDKALGAIFQQFPNIDGLPDSDGDGVNDASEIILGTDANKKDSNGNGVSDKEELSAKLGDPRDADSDGLSDTLETFFGTDPNKADSDSDGFKDGVEVINGFNPKSTGKLFP